MCKLKSKSFTLTSALHTIYMTIDTQAQNTAAHHQTALQTNNVITKSTLQVCAFIAPIRPRAFALVTILHFKPVPPTSDQVLAKPRPVGWVITSVGWFWFVTSSSFGSWSPYLLPRQPQNPIYPGFSFELFIYLFIYPDWNQTCCQFEKNKSMF